MVAKPLIGITLDSRETGEYSKYPWYAVRQNYCDMIIKAGGIPFLLTHDLDLTDTYLSLIQGLVLTGGRHDINPTLYGESSIHPTVTLNPRRSEFELHLARAALEKNMPILGICGGEQVLNVTLGGTLYQHLPDDIPGCLTHLQVRPRTEPAHAIKIEKGTLLYQIFQTEERAVNSVHHQAVKRPGEGVVVSAVAPDGVIEAIEVPAYRFCLGVQWHPEYAASPLDQEIFKSFMQAVREQG